MWAAVEAIAHDYKFGDEPKDVRKQFTKNLAGKLAAALEPATEPVPAKLSAD
jgi:hypothetical protein